MLARSSNVRAAVGGALAWRGGGRGGGGGKSWTVTNAVMGSGAGVRTLCCNEQRSHAVMRRGEPHPHPLTHPTPTLIPHPPMPPLTSRTHVLSCTRTCTPAVSEITPFAADAGLAGAPDTNPTGMAVPPWDCGQRT